MSRSQWAAAGDLWAAILAQLPGDDEATKGLSDAQASMNQASSIDAVVGDSAVQREEAQVTFDNSLIRADNLFSRGDYAGAERVVVQAKAGLARSRGLLSPADFDERMGRADADLVKIKSAQTDEADTAKAVGAQDQTAAAAAENRQELEKRQQTINENMARVRQLQSELKYKEALEVVQEILFIDPNNPAALALRDTIESGILYRRYTELQRRRAFAFSEMSVDSQASFIPPKVNLSGPGPRSLDAIVAYPEDWPQISSRREAAAGFKDTEADQGVMAKLRERIAVDFNETEAEQVFTYLKEVTGLDFYIDWKSLDTVGITKSSPISLTFPQIRGDKALDLALEAAAGDAANPTDAQANHGDWTVEDGIILVASTEALALRRVTIVYDVRDLLFRLF